MAKNEPTPRDLSRFDKRRRLNMDDLTPEEKCPFPRLREYPGCYEDCPDTEVCPMKLAKGDALADKTDPVLAELWDNDKDAAYDQLAKRLDKPELREKIRDIKMDGVYLKKRKTNFGYTEHLPDMYIDQLLLLFPDIEEAKREARSEALNEVGKRLSKSSIHSTFDTKGVEKCYLIQVKDWQAIKQKPEEKPSFIVPGELQRSQDY